MHYNKVVSVIIPTFNCQNYIDEAIRSLINQTYKDLEIIVIDDGSTDDTRKVLDKYITSNNIFYYFQNNSGVAAARNYGIEKSTGQIICFLDADDTLLSESIEMRVNAFKEFPIAKLAFSDYYIEKFKRDATPFIKGSSIEKELFQYVEKTGHNCLLLNEDFYKYFSNIQPSVVWTGAVSVYKSVFENVGHFNDNMYVSEDTDMWKRILKKYRALYVHKPLSRYLSYRGEYNKYEKHYIQLIEENVAKIENGLCKNDLKKRRKLISNAYLAIAYKKYIPMLEFGQARKILFKSIEYYPSNMFAWKQFIMSNMPVNLYLLMRKIKRNITDIRLK